MLKIGRKIVRNKVAKGLTKRYQINHARQAVAGGSPSTLHILPPPHPKPPPPLPASPRTTTLHILPRPTHTPPCISSHGAQPPYISSPDPRTLHPAYPPTAHNHPAAHFARHRLPAPHILPRPTHTPPCISSHGAQPPCISSLSRHRLSSSASGLAQSPPSLPPLGVSECVPHVASFARCDIAPRLLRVAASLRRLALCLPRASLRRT